MIFDITNPHFNKTRGNIDLSVTISMTLVRSIFPICRDKNNNNN